MTEESDAGREPGYHPAKGTGLLLSALLLAGSSPTWLLVIAGALMLLAFLCSLFENALQHFSRAQLADATDDPALLDKLDSALLHEDEILFASKVGRGLFQMLGIALIVVAMVEIRPSAVISFLVALVVAVLFIVINVAGPYVLGMRMGHVVLIRGLLPYNRALSVLRPFSSLLQRLVARLLGAGAPPDPAQEIADELRSVVEEGTREGTLDSSEKRMIEGVILLRNVTADHVMTPRTEMVCVPVEATVDEALTIARDRGLSRLPVYRETLDQVCGLLYMKDLLPHVGKNEGLTVSGIARRPFFIPQSKNVLELMQEMRVKQTHMAIVLDEYGGTAGIVTFEDILEEIVGEIADEHEGSTVEDVVRIAGNAAHVGGRTHIDDLNDALDLDVPESEEYETVGGLLFSRMGRIPAAGEHYDLEEVRFTVLEADERRITRVKVTVQRP